MNRIPMLQIAKLPLARRIWRICKELKISIHDPIISNMDIFDLDFYEFSLLCDNPKLLEQYENRYFDPEFDEWVEEFDKEQQSNANKLDSPDEDTIKYSNRVQNNNTQVPISNEYEIGDSSQIDENDWEQVE